ncbi:restriction endonuclease [Billgrantia sp. C5P2]|uniref:restriction endonuclease n=1 Tax=Billgrantia sp. C5P2 TaxID=3436239 RepID=UPI003DA5890F
MSRHELVKKPRDLESYVQYVYSTLLNLRDEGVVVASNSILIGRSGAKHEIDVFYQFERSGVVHRVAFECKFTGRKVQKSDVLDFHAKLQDVGNLQGIFVSKSGYQSGALEYAEHYGVQLLELEDLPTLNILVGNRIKAVALPDETYIGEPFWAIMESKDGRLTGSYWAKKDGGFFERSIIPLFISKSDASTFISSLADGKNYVVRGLPQHSLSFLLKTAGVVKGRVKFLLFLNGREEDGKWLGVLATPEEVSVRFLINSH